MMKIETDSAANKKDGSMPVKHMQQIGHEIGRVIHLLHHGNAKRGPLIPHEKFAVMRLKHWSQNRPQHRPIDHASIAT